MHAELYNLIHVSMWGYVSKRCSRKCGHVCMSKTKEENIYMVPFYARIRTSAYAHVCMCVYMRRLPYGRIF